MPEVSQVVWHKYSVSITDTGSDQKILTVPTDTIVMISGIRVTTARIGGTITYTVSDSDGTDEAPGANILMTDALIASTATGLKRNTTVLGVSLFLLTTASSVWLDVTEVVAPSTRPVFTVYILAARITPGESL